MSATLLSTIVGDLSDGALASLAYGAVGLAAIALGYLVVDLLTPGKLSRLICEDRNWNATIVVVANLLAVGTIVVTAIVTAHDDLGKGLVDTLSYGILGIAMLAVAFVVVDLITPGRLGDIVTHHEPQPAVLLTAAADLVVGAVIAAAIS